VSVTDLLRYAVDGSRETHMVELFEVFQSQSSSHECSDSVKLLANATVDLANLPRGPLDRLGFSSAQVSTSVPLAGGHTYRLVSSENSGGDRWMDANTPVSVTTTSPFEVVASVYYQAQTGWAWGSTGSYSYGPVSLNFAIKDEFVLHV
jgi:hypothetical protein